MSTAISAQQSITLEDGRRMAYAVFGDSAGQPCLFVHGFSSSRWLAGWALSAKVLRRHSVRLVAVDRPGYGLSTANPAGGFTDWACDAAALAGHLGLGRLAVIGVSMGAGPALALAATRPDLVTSTTILSGMPPIGPGERWAPDSRGDALYWRLARHAPWLLRRLCSATATMTGASTRGDADRVIRRVERGLPDADARAFRELVRDADARTAFVADLSESSRQGGAAMADDLRRYLRPWGFEPADVSGPVRLWHGTEDPKVPVTLARRLAARLPRVSARFVPGGHFAAFAHQDEIIGEIEAERR
ncbi:alpha/beta fold hydrolase [Nonomuraea angiospora]|uniref:Pimeloyl-ACP methyl ester carboxylesterase n=1 Tax=Nonomuraea angiospora TaxID=46172 RepID=A0ABR9LUQ9_9ACTN|nr:alpha/beta hydrolase [Nonomuraea angiospora]MBE1584372.1 pimeloyl-ACP methyl ester carboxylesterase [Nonomuraea angiospora]